MKNKFLSAFLTVVLSGNIAIANVYNHPSNLAAIINELPEMEDISCKFKQEKHLKNIEKPVVSTGNFKFSKNNGVCFETLSPIKSNVCYSGNEHKQINEIVKAITNKNYNKIEKEFDLYFSQNEKDWTLGLKPKSNSQVSNYMSSITIYGKNSINKIDIILKNGNSTILWFFEK